MYDDVTFELVAKPAPEELAAFYERQSHPTTQSLEKLEGMMANTFCFVSARRNGELIGIARGVTDGIEGRLIECKLDPAYQGPACVTRTDGRIEHDSSDIAREMATLVMEALRAAGVERITTMAYATEVDFCEELGFKTIRGMVAMARTAEAPWPTREATSTSAVSG